MATKSQLKAMQQRRAQAVSRGQAQSIRPEVARGLPQSIRAETIRPDVALPHALPAQPGPAAQERLHGQGVLHVLVRRASGLKGADRGGTSSDPYVVVKIGAQEQRTLFQPTGGSTHYGTAGTPAPVLGKPTPAGAQNPGGTRQGSAPIIV